MGPRANMEGFRREDAAKDNMRQYGFDESVIDETIKELVKLYGKDGWRLIEDGEYNALLTRCLERQEEKAKEKEEPELTSPNSGRRLVRGVSAPQRGWVSEDDDEEEEKEEMDLDDSDDDEDDNKVIRLTPEPLCEELEKLLRDVHGEN